MRETEINNAPINPGIIARNVRNLRTAAYATITRFAGDLRSRIPLLKCGRSEHLDGGGDGGLRVAL